MTKRAAVSRVRRDTGRTSWPGRCAASSPRWPLPWHGRRRRHPRTARTSNSARSIFRPRATRSRSGASIAPCATSIRSGTARPGRSSRRCSRPIPQCAIAYWGIALSLLLNPHVPPPRGQPRARPGRAGEGQGARRRRRSASATTSTALLAFYTDHDTVPHGARVQRYLKAMEALAQRYPDDDEAQIGYAIALNVAASPNDKTYANQLKGAAILEPIFRRQPRHPGVAHYLIHLYDYPPIAAEGPGRGEALCRDRAGGAARPAHALAHLHARGLLEGVDRHPTPPRRAPRRPARSRTTSCTRWTTWSMPICSSRRTSEARAVVDEMVAVTGYNPNVRTRAAMPSRPARPATWSSAATGQAPPALRVQAEPVRLRRRHHAFRPRAGRGALRQPGRRPGGHREARRAARRAARRRTTPTGRSRWTSSGRSRAPGCCRPRASTTRRSAR